MRRRAFIASLGGADGVAGGGARAAIGTVGDRVSQQRFVFKG
jgi:hypothetical protein